MGRLGGGERRGMRRDVSRHAVAPFLFADPPEGSIREIRTDPFVVSSRRRPLARAHRVAERRRALFRQLCFRERCQPMDRGACMADDPRSNNKYKRAASGGSVLSRRRRPMSERRQLVAGSKAHPQTKRVVFDRDQCANAVKLHFQAGNRIEPWCEGAKSGSQWR